MQRPSSSALATMAASSAVCQRCKCSRQATGCNRTGFSYRDRVGRRLCRQHRCVTDHNSLIITSAPATIAILRLIEVFLTARVFQSRWRQIECRRQRWTFATARAVREATSDSTRVERVVKRELGGVQLLSSPTQLTFSPRLSSTFGMSDVEYTGKNGSTYCMALQTRSREAHRRRCRRRRTRVADASTSLR